MGTPWWRCGRNSQAAALGGTSYLGTAGLALYPFLAHVHLHRERDQQATHTLLLTCFAPCRISDVAPLGHCSSLVHLDLAGASTQLTTVQSLLHLARLEHLNLRCAHTLVNGSTSYLLIALGGSTVSSTDILRCS